MVLKVDTLQLGVYAGIVQHHQDSEPTWRFADHTLRNSLSWRSRSLLRRTRTSLIGRGCVAPRDDDLTQDSILRDAYVGAWLLGLVLLALPVAGAIRWPHPVWAAPISCALLGLAANHRIRRAGGRGETILLGVLTLAFLVGAATLTKVALDAAR